MLDSCRFRHFPSVARICPDSTNDEEVSEHHGGANYDDHYGVVVAFEHSLEDGTRRYHVRLMHAELGSDRAQKE